MPTVLRMKGYRFFFFSNENFEPMHIHVEKDNNYAKYWIKPLLLARSKGFRSHELVEIQKIVENNKKLFEERWNEFFGN